MLVEMERTIWQPGSKVVDEWKCVRPISTQPRPESSAASEKTLSQSCGGNGTKHVILDCHCVDLVSGKKKKKAYLWTHACVYVTKGSIVAL